MEIHYCGECRTRVSSIDIEQGKGISQGTRVYCETCARKLGLDSRAQKKSALGASGAPRKKGSGVKRTGSGVKRTGSGVRRTGSGTRRAGTGSRGRRSSSSASRQAHQPSSVSPGAPQQSRHSSIRSRPPAQKQDVFTLLIALLGIVVVVLLVLIALILTRQVKLQKEKAADENVPVSEEADKKVEKPAEKEKPAEEKPAENKDSSGETEKKEDASGTSPAPAGETDKKAEE